MFDLIHANTVRRRMSELRKFIDVWYGPHQRAFELPEPDARLPLPLQLFYRHNAHRPFFAAPTENTESFYEGSGGHHLFQPTELTFHSQNRIKFFMEYQGDWDGYTLKSEDDPPVWLSGALPTDESFAKTEQGERKLWQSLSEFLVTHVLLTSIYEDENSPIQQYGSYNEALVDKFRRARARKKIIWDAGDFSKPYCPHYAGKIYLYCDSILVHEDPRGHLVFGSNNNKSKRVLNE